MMPLLVRLKLTYRIARIRPYGWSLALVAAATILGFPVHTAVSPVNLVMLYLAAVVIAALYLGRGPSMLAASLGVLCFDFFFVPPYFTFAIEQAEFLFTFAVLFVVGVIVSTLTARVREEANAARRHEAQTVALYRFSRELAAAATFEQIFQAIFSHICQTFGCDVIIFLRQTDDVVLHASSPQLKVSPLEKDIANVALQTGQPAGYGTTIFSDVPMRYVPLKTGERVIGILAVRPAGDETLLNPEMQRLLDSFAAQGALALERAQLAEQARRIEMLQATEKLQTALLNSISHDLRTPLASITGSLSSLQEEAVDLDKETRQSLIENAREEAERLNRLVGNLLDMTRIEGDALKVALEPSDVQDLIGSALQRLKGRIKTRSVSVDLAPDLPLVPMDFVLMVQVLCNLLENALKFSGPDQPIEISARVESNCLALRVKDRGIGIPPQDLERVFGKFYRVQRPDGVVGTGLGLAISKGIVEAHGGRIFAARRQGGGTELAVLLPLTPAGNCPKV